VPEPEGGNWCSEVVLDLDHILEWLSGPDGMRFRIVPATLTFENAAACAWRPTRSLTLASRCS
jgi:hypothetical protein